MCLLQLVRKNVEGLMENKTQRTLDEVEQEYIDLRNQIMLRRIIRGTQQEQERMEREITEMKKELGR